MSGSGRDALQDVWKWSGGLPGCPEVFGRPSLLYGSFREALPDVGSGRESLRDVRECLGGPLVCPGVFARPSRMCESGREALSYVRLLS